MKSFTILWALMGLNSFVSAHMDLCYPPSLRYQDNPNVPSNLIDYSLTSPLKADGSDFPCKGYQSDLGSAAGASVVTWAAGGSYNFTLGGDAPHSGGSCQIALSYDKGKSFTVIHSYVGGCPLKDTYDFVLPADTPPGAALFGWTWFNEVGNREMYMNCASVTITGSGSTKRAGASFSSRPSLFVANLNNGCSTVSGEDVTFPDPGPDVTTGGTTLGGVTGICKAVNGIGDFSSGSGSATASPAGASSANTVAGTMATVASSIAVQSSGGSQTFAVAGTTANAASSVAVKSSSGSQTFATSTTASPAASSTSISSTTLSLSSDGSCSGSHTCQGSIHGNCCSKWGWCGSTSDYCGTGCQPAFGTCGSASTNTTLNISTDQTCGGTTGSTCQGSSYGNCCSQYGYCGSTSEFCGTGCRGAFGTCGQSSSGVSTSSAATPSGNSAPSSPAMSTSTAALSTTSTATMFATSLSKPNSPAAPTSGPPQNPHDATIFTVTPRTYPTTGTTFIKRVRSSATTSATAGAY